MVGRRLCASSLSAVHYSPYCSPAFRHRLREPLEKVMAVLWPRRCFGMVLDGKHRLAFDFETAIRSIEERNMRLPESGRQRVTIDGEAVVHRHDLHFAGAEVHDRMICAMMALRHLHGLCAQRQPEHL